MNISRRTLITTGAMSLASLGLAACDLFESGGMDSYIIATDTNFVPFEYADEEGAYVGIDIDIMKAVSVDQDFILQLQPIGFDNAVKAVQNGTADGIIAGFSKTEEREELFDFSETYFDSTVCCAAFSSSDINSLEDLAGKKVAVKKGTMSEMWAESLKGQYGFETVQFETSDLLYEDVFAGNTDACCEDTPVMKYAISIGYVDFKIVQESSSNSEYATPYAFAVKKGSNKRLLTAFDEGIRNIKSNGKLDEIIAKYMDVAEETAE